MTQVDRKVEMDFTGRFITFECIKKEHLCLRIYSQMIHELKLHNEPFRNIQKGIKKVEARLLDEKRQQIKIGDSIIFTNRDYPTEHLYTKVIELFHYPTFNEMFSDLHKKYRSRCSREQLENSMEKYYSIEDEKKYGAVGIHIELIPAPHEETLTAYNTHFDAYLANTIAEPSAILKQWIDKTLAGMSVDSIILEVGTGTWRDANYIESLWYHVIRTDWAEGFVQYNKAQGKDASVYNVISDTLADKYDLIFADAVLLHFPHKQCEAILRHRKEHLTTHGKVSRCVQEWQWEAIKENKNMKRYFYFWKEEQVKDMMNNIWYSHIETRVDEPEPGRRRVRCIATI